MMTQEKGGELLSSSNNNPSETYDHIIRHYAHEIRSFCISHRNRQMYFSGFFLIHINIFIILCIISFKYTIFIIPAIVAIFISIMMLVSLRKLQERATWILPMLESLIRLDQITKQTRQDLENKSFIHQMIITDVELAIRAYDTIDPTSGDRNFISRLFGKP